MMPIRYVNADGTTVQPEPGPINLEVYYGSEKLYAPGWVEHLPSNNGIPYISVIRLQGPCRERLG
jgi:hypothetical protein